MVKDYCMQITSKVYVWNVCILSISRHCFKLRSWYRYCAAFMCSILLSTWTPKKWFARATRLTWLSLWILTCYMPVPRTPSSLFVLLYQKLIMPDLNWLQKCWSLAYDYDCCIKLFQLAFVLCLILPLPSFTLLLHVVYFLFSYHWLWYAYQESQHVGVLKTSDNSSYRKNISTCGEVWKKRQ